MPNSLHCFCERNSTTTLSFHVSLRGLPNGIYPPPRRSRLPFPSSKPASRGRMIPQVDPLFLWFLITFVFVSLFFLRRKKAAAANSPPSPPGLPLLGNLHQLGASPHRSLLSLAEKYGPVMLLHFGRIPTLVVSSPEAVQEVMKTHDLTFSGRPEMSMARRLFYDSHDVIFSTYGEYWRQVRRICVLRLLSTKRVRSFRHVREEEVAAMVGRIRAATSSGSSRQAVVNVSELIITLTNDTICRAAFGRRYSEQAGGDGGRSFGEMIAELMSLLGAFPVGDFIPWLAWFDKLSGLDARASKNSMELDQVIEKVIEDHIRAHREGRRASGSSDFVDVLLSLDEKEDDIGVSLSRDHIKALLLDMFVAGTETTYASAEWAMAELMRHPKEMRRAQEEVRRIVGSKEEVGEDLTESMSYLKAVIKESLRLHPPAPLIPRQTMQDTQLLGYDVPARTRVLISAWAIGRDPRAWERAEEFWPERFVNDSFDIKVQDFQLVPFGGGRRGCPGIEFGIPTVELVLANLLHHFDWEMPDGMKGESLDMSEAAGITVHRKFGLMLVAKPRNP